MVPGALTMPMPWRSAKPERGRTWPSYPGGISRAIPVGTSARCPGSSRTSTSARRSSPALPSVAWAGRGSGSPRPPTRTTRTRIIGSIRLGLDLRLGGGRAVARLSQGLLARKPDLPLPVDREDLHQDLVALGEDVRDALDPLVGELGDVDQAVGAGEELHEGAELHDTPHRPEVGLPDLRLLREVADHLDGLLDLGGVRRGDVDGPVVLDVDGASGAGDDVADHLAAGPDHVLDALGADLDGGDPRRP